MDQKSHHQRPRRRSAASATPHFSEKPYSSAARNSDPLIIRLISAPLLFLFSPFLSDREPLPSRLAHAAVALLRRFSLGLLAALLAVTVLVAALAVAALIGVGLVKFWVEKPVFFRHPLHFDYTNEHPIAVVAIGGGGGKGRAIPAGHTTTVWVELLVPDSDFNRRIGVFQVTAEAISSKSNIIASSSKPCMLRFWSLPVRLTRTFIMAIPLLLGMCSESQKIAFEILKYKEIHQKPTERIVVRLKPRAGTSDVPQLYEAEILMNSQLPWSRRLVYDWKWTSYVWVSLCVYILLVIVLVCCFKQFAFPRRISYRQVDHPKEVEEEDPSEDGELEPDEFAAALRRWRECGRRKRKVQEVLGGPASNITEGEMGEVIEDSGDFAASESSECFGG